MLFNQTEQLLSFKRNILANYASQIYGTLISIVMVPLYIKYMGAETYGLVGFFAMLQAWFQLLDMGLTPTMARETARFNGGATDSLSLRRLLRALEGVFVGIALLGGLAMVLASETIAGSWLKAQELSLAEVQRAIILMAVIVALRWVCGLYRGAISGFERLVWLSGFNSVVATARFVLVIPVFVYVGTNPTAFFSYQLLIAVAELLVLVAQTYRLLPKVKVGQHTPWQWQPLRGVLKFSLSIAFGSSVWVLVTQTDKLLLSKLLPLTAYGHFTLAVLVASGVLMVSGPISNALLPRLTKLASEGDEVELIAVYRKATQLMGIIAIPASLILAFFGDKLLLAWTGDPLITNDAAPILRLYALGNGFLTLAAFPYYLQYAKGNLKLHIISNVIFVTVLAPIMIWSTIRYGAIGAGYTWLGVNAVYFLAWTPFVHRKFSLGLHEKWLLQDIAPIATYSLIAVAGIYFSQILSGYWGNIFEILSASLVTLLAASAGSSWIRKILSNIFRV